MSYNGHYLSYLLATIICRNYIGELVDPHAPGRFCRAGMLLKSAMSCDVKCVEGATLEGKATYSCQDGKLSVPSTADGRCIADACKLPQVDDMLYRCRWLK